MEVKRIPPYPDYDIRGTESWLEEMSSNGYILCKGYAFQYGFAYFETGEPRRIRYRLEPAEDTLHPPEEEILKFHADFGWEYITSRGQFWIFACEDPTAPEMHTDPRIQAVTLKLVEKRLVRHFLNLLIFGLFYSAPHSGYLFCGTLIHRGRVYYTPHLVFFVLVCVAWVPGILHLIRFRKTLKLGSFPEHTTHPAPLKTYARLVLRVLPFVWVFAALSLFPDSHNRSIEALTPQSARELSVLTVADLYPGADISYISASSRLTQWSTDAADALELTEHFRITLPDGSTATGLWYTTRYETASGWIAGGYARERRLQAFLRGSVASLDISVDGADWCSAFHADSFRGYGVPREVLLIQKGDVFYEISLVLYCDTDFPAPFTRDELAQLVLEQIG